MTEFAAALNKRDRDEMAALSGVERMDALERRLAKAEAKLADANWKIGPTGMLPLSPPADTDPVM